MRASSSSSFMLACVAAGVLSFAPARAGAPPGRYTVDSTNGTVLDNQTGLMWQQDSTAFAYAWRDAVAYCETLALGGHTDWRLPNLKELYTIVDLKTRNPSLDLSAFMSHGGKTWSSSPCAASTTTVWYVDFYDGYVGNGLSTGTAYVRCVR